MRTSLQMDGQAVRHLTRGRTPERDRAGTSSSRGPADQDARRHHAGLTASTGGATALPVHSTSRPRVSGMVVYTSTPTSAAAATYSHTRSRWPLLVSQVVMYGAVPPKR